MIVVKLQGGLGNQMFQYALGKAMAKLHHSALALDLDFLLDRDFQSDTFTFRAYDLDVLSVEARVAAKGIKLKYESQSLTDKIRSGFRSKHIYKERFFHYDDKVMNQQPDVYLEGYWQSMKYFQIK